MVAGKSGREAASFAFLSDKLNKELSFSSFAFGNMKIKGD